MKTLFSSSWVHRTSWLMILIQILSPISLAVSSVVHAAKIEHAESTLAGMQAVIDGKPIQDVNNLPALGSENNNASGEKSSKNDSAERVVAGGASRAGQLLSSEDSTRATINYAKGIAESLINNEINDWLNQKGNGRISIGSDKTVSGDVLVPLSESDNSLLFTQGGLRTKEDRNTVNLGVGYRQYVDDWMYGINSFYDYDYTGKNARLGVGTEAWTNYLKLAANGYIGLTDWHQSKISSMRDYDERPANGFDLRAEAWLPSWPQLGGKLKYEQYFGKDIDLGTGSVSPDKLKDNPKALTAGLTYTPFPLISFSGERSIGDRNQTRVGMDLNYRFGVPLHQQLSADSVDMMRSLAGNRYELVDRNYDIVMQYRKQELLRISLPETVNAQAADTVRIPVTVHKAKYGLKDTEWTPSAEFVTNGGSLRKLSATEVEVKVPAYAWNIRTGQAQEYTLKAVGTDANGNRSNTASTIIRVAPSRNVISSLTVSPDTAVPADNAQFATLTATVTDEAGQPLGAQTLTFSVTGLTDAQSASVATLFTDSASDAKQLTVTTDARGQALVMVRSKIAKDGTVTVKMDNGNFKSAQVKFIADAASAQVSALKVTKDNAIADGVSANELVATVQDVNGNPLENFTVGADVDNDGVVDTSGVTDSNGNTTLKVMNARAGATNVTVRAGSSVRTIQTATVNFVVDKSVAEISEGDLTVVSGAVANGTDSNAVTIKVTDGRGNAVAGVTLQLSAAEGANLSMTKLESGADGMAHTSITSLRAGTYEVKVTILESGKTAQAQTAFIADESTAEITDANLVIDPDGAAADGVAKNGVTATVTDAQGNLVPGAAVSFTVEDGASITTVSGTTGADGKAAAEVTSTTAGTYIVTATVNGKATQKNTTFVADGATAEITDANLTIVPDNSPANGTAKNGVIAVVTDGQGNLVPGAAVSFTVEDGASITTVTGTTGTDGKATAEVTSTAAGTYAVTATVNGKSTQRNTTFVADLATANITDANLSISPDGSVANGHETNGVEAVVTDVNGNVVAGAEVSFSMSSDKASVTTLIGTTGADGKATATVTSTTAGTYVVTAKVNGTETRKNTTFVADSTTAEIKDANLTIDPDGAVADGATKNSVAAVVSDAHGNLVSGAVVSFSVESGASITTVNGTTGSDGKATADITSTTAGTYAVTATVNGKSVHKNTTFVADTGTAEIVAANMVVDPDGAAANGADKNTVTVLVTDAQGNVVPDTEVSFNVAGSAAITPASGKTDDNGKVSADITTTVAGTYKVSASVNGKTQAKDTTFIADGTTAEITDANLTIAPDNSPANGMAKNGVVAVVTDAQGNLVPGAAVSFTVEDGASITTVIGTTGADGRATAEVIATTAGTYQVTATVNGKATQKNTTFVPDSATAEITDANLTIVPDNSPANGTAKNGVVAVVTDAQGNLVADATVSFTVEDGASITTITGTTGADGKATAEVTSTTAGTYIVTATVNGKATSKNTTFVPDSATAEITDANLTIVPDNSPANGTAKNGVVAVVTDAHGNLVADAEVSFTVEDGASITTITGTTGADGKATAEVTATAAGTYLVTATVNGKATQKNTTFVPDSATAEITDANLVIDPDGAAADGVAKNGVTATVTDAQGNLVPGAAVSFTVEDGASITTITGTTGADGKATAEVTATAAGTYLVTATVHGKATQKNTTFVPDSATAEITDANLTIDPDNSPANGSAKNGVVAVVTDAQGNLVPGAAVSFTVEDGASITTVIGTTGADGKATAEVISTAAGTYLVTATVNGKATSKNTTFIPDSATAEITDANLVIDPDGAVADGVAKNGVEATVTDANGNLVPGIEVDFRISEGANIHVVQGTTDENGKAYAEITSMKAGTFLVSANVAGSAQFARKNTRFVADMSTAKIELVRLGDKEQFVVGSNANYTATAMDANGNLITDAEFELDVKGSENANGAILVVNDGVAALFVTDTKVGDVELSVVLQQNNNVKASGSVAFIADKETATIAENDLTVLKTGAVASGTDENIVQARVTDAYGNILSDMDVTFGVNKTATLVQAVIKTDSEGLAVAHLTDTEVETVTVTATINGNSQAVEVEFVVGHVNPSASTVELDPVRIAANGTEQATITVKLEDFFGHPVPGKNVTVDIHENEPVTATAGVQISETVDHADGSYSLTVNGTQAGTVQFHVRADGNSTGLVTNWLTLDSTGEIADSDMIVDPDRAVANGVAKNVVTAIVKDFGGNPVAGDEVTFNVEEGAVLTPVTTTTGDDGKAVAEITSTKAGSFKVTATVNGKSTSKHTTFVADAKTARMVLTAVNPLDSHPAGSKASFTASVQDANGNVFKDAEIELSASGTETTEAGITGVSDGVANLFVTDTKVGEVSLTVNQKGNSELSAAETVKFIADISTARVLESDFDTPKANAIANGEDEAEITASVTDQYGNPIPVGGGSTSIPENGVRLSIDLTGTTTPGFSSRTNYSENTITYNVTQSNSGTYSVRPLINGNPVPYLDSKNVKFIPVLREFRFNNNNQPADGVSPITLVVRLTHGMSDAASGYSGVVSFTATNGAVMSSEQITTSGGGAGTGYGPVNVRNVNPGTSTVTATFEQSGIVQQLTVDVEFVNAATILDNDLIINPDNAVANGADKNVVTAIVTDGNGTAVAGEEVTFNVENGPELTVVSATSDADGKAVAELTSTVAGSFKVTATINGNTVSKNTTFVADASTAAIELTRTDVQETYVAGTRIGYTVVAKDANGNTITDAKFDVKAEGGSAASASITATNNGMAVLSLYDTRAGETKLTATLANNAEVAANDTVTYVPDESSAQISNLTVVKDYAFANSSDEDIVTFNATDKYQNLLPGVETSAFTVSVARTGASWVLSQLEDGSFEVRIKGSSTSNHPVVINHGSWASVQQSVSFQPVVSAEVEVNNASANGLSENVVRARFYSVAGDGSVAGVANSRVAFSADNGATVSRAGGFTDSDGYATASVTNTTPGVTIVKAISNESLYGYTTEEVEVNFEPVIELKDQNVVIEPDNAPADGVSKNVVTATVTNQNGSPVAGAEVSFDVEAGPALSVVNGTTGADGKAVAELTSLQKGVFNVTVKVNASEVTKPVTFISNAVIKDENMVVDPDGAISNAIERNQVTAIVTDSAGNPLSGETVEFTVEEGPTLYPIITTTGDDGKAIAELASGKFGTFNVTATVNGKSTTKPTTFVQWGIAVVEANIIKNNALADEEDTNEIEAKVEDGNLNPVAGAKVTFWVEGNSNARPITFVENEVLTDENGYARTNIKANRPGSYQIVASAYDYSTASKSAWFTFVTSGVNTDKSALKVTPPIIKANNNESATIELKVRDKFDTAITGQDVSFVIENEDGSLPAEGAIMLSAVTEGDPVILNEAGYYTATLKGATPGRYKITPVVEGNRVGLSEVIELTSTAQILESGLTLELDGSVADGEAKNIVTATVTDFAGKPVSGETVVFTGDDGIVITTVTETTGADGKALAELTSTSAGTFIVRASVNGSTAQIETNFVAGLAVSNGHSTMGVNIPRIIANGGGKVDGEDVARVTFVAKDAFDNVVTGLVNTGALSFVAKDESQNVINDSQQIHINNVSETTEGVYVADVQGKYVGKVTIHPVIQQGTEESYSPDVNSTITLFDYSFKVNSDKIKIIVGGTSGFYIHATSSDNVDSNLLLADSDNLTYVSSNTAVITINSNGDATGVGVGESLISATGEYKGISLGESNTLGILASVKQPVTYGPFGDSGNSQARHELFIVREEDNYSLFARGGSIVDAIGVSDTHKIGGNGGGKFILTSLNKVSRITTCTTPDIYEEGNASLREGISQIRIEYRNGQATDVIGANDINTSDCSHVVEVPEGYSLDGFDVRGNVYIHSVGYILNPDGFE